ncbi:MAG TPA: hypothetical protein VFC18_18980 [Burkholderiales bacterium]|nr:hypothetical protein [Burkholderiales bacterium]
MSPKVGLPRDKEIGEIFDEVLAEMLEEERERERRGEPPPARKPLSPELEQAGEALKAIFEGEHHLTADLSFDQVYAKVLPHFITIWKHMMREQAVVDSHQPPPDHGHG